MSTYALEGPKWATNTITWSFAPPGGSFTNAIAGAYQAVIEQAFAAWAQAVNVSFQQLPTGTAGADILIGWGNFASSTLVPGGNQIGETDYTYSGSGSSETFLPGMTVRLEDPALDPVASTQGAAYQGTATTLYQVALHEIGHALGLGLDSNPSAVMYLELGPANTAISASDIAGAQSLYGAPANPPATASITTTSIQTQLPAAVDLSNNEVSVYRFFETTNGSQFLTADLNERNAVIQTRPDLVYEGLGFAAVGSVANDPAATQVYRFFDTANGTHFFTASAAEDHSILATMPSFVPEGGAFYEDLTQQPGDVPVYRFFDASNGTHFFTSSATEEAAIQSTRADMRYEGIAFYAPSSS